MASFLIADGRVVDAAGYSSQGQILQPCVQQPCGNLVVRGRCPQHEGQGYDSRRGKTVERGYDWDWKKLSATKLAADPICEMRTHCEGVVATEVDHVVPIATWPEGRLVWTNLKSGCKPCHSAKTERENREKRRVSR